MRNSAVIRVILTLLVACSGPLGAQVSQDPLIRMPGTQPGDGVVLESPNRCLNCHAGYDQAVEPGFNWQGSMMAHAMRDPLYWACLTVAAQDANWAVGSPGNPNYNATDICLRCHAPQGWLEGRSDPTNGSAMRGADFDGVQCDFCHRQYDPFFEDTFNGSREGTDWAGYWDEANAISPSSATAALATRQEDALLAQTVTLFNGSPFYINDLPHSATYTESASGQYFVSHQKDKRASFVDADARHQMLYSRYHKSKYFCSTCHDVSNPVLANLGADPAQALPTELQSAHSYFHVERTFSEFMLSDYGLQGGAAGIGPFAPGTFDTSRPGDVIASCQDCHLRDVPGAAADKNGVITRPSGSTEHPKSGVPLHDMTGGNIWVSYLIASAIPGSPNYSAINDGLLNQGAAVLTMDLNEGLGVDPVATLAGTNRAKQMLQWAAAIENLVYDEVTGVLSFRVQNQTGHKLISGFPEGRRMFLNVLAYDAGGQLLLEVNPYDAAAGTLKGLSHQSSPPLAGNEMYVDELVYETHPSSSLTGENETFHFVLATDRYKDNRIPPKGFRIGEAPSRICTPRWHGVDDPGYFTSAEYAGGYDDVSLTVAPGAQSVVVKLYYQVTSREYVEFLRDEINATNMTLPASAYVIQSDPFFDGLRAWGNTIWQLWLNNKDVPGAAPFLMTEATFGTPPTPPCQVPDPPQNLTATGDRKRVTLQWQAPATAPTGGYVIYYAGTATVVATVASNTLDYVDRGLPRQTQFCYELTSWNDCNGNGQYDAGTDTESARTPQACATTQ